MTIFKDMSNLRENGIGSNYKTVNNNPISHFNDSRIKVEIYPGAWGSVHANVECKELGFSSGLKSFKTDQDARTYAINMHDKLVSKLNALQENVLLRILREMGE